MKHRLAENLAAPEITLTAYDLRRFDDAADSIAIEGARGTGHEQHD